MSWYAQNSRRAYPFRPSSFVVSDPVDLRRTVVDAAARARVLPAFDPNVAHTSVLSLSRSGPTTYTGVVRFAGYLPVVTDVAVVPATTSPAGLVILTGETDDYSVRLVVNPESPNGLAVGDTWTGGATRGTGPIATFEPALTAVGCRVTSLTMWNATASRAADVSCPAPAYSVAPGWRRPIGLPGPQRGVVTLVPGASAVLGLPGRLLVGASAGAGTGIPCEPPRRYAEDVPPPGRTTRDGGVPCGTVVRTWNGIGGPNVRFDSATGVRVEEEPISGGILITVGSWGLARCPGATDG